MPQFQWLWILALLHNHWRLQMTCLPPPQDQLNQNSNGGIHLGVFIFSPMIFMGSQSLCFVVMFLPLFMVFSSFLSQGQYFIHLCLPSNWDCSWHIVGGQGFFLNSKWNTHEDKATLTELIKAISLTYSESYSQKVFIDTFFKVPMQSSAWEVLDFISNLGPNSNWKLSWWWGE